MSNMEVIKRGTTPNGYDLVIEEWAWDQPATLAPYLVVAFTPAKGSAPGRSFGPRLGDTWRWEFKADTLEQAEGMLAQLEAGTEPAAFVDLYNGRPEYVAFM